MLPSWCQIETDTWSVQIKDGLDVLAAGKGVADETCSCHASMFNGGVTKNSALHSKQSMDCKQLLMQQRERSAADCDAVAVNRGGAVEGCAGVHHTCASS